jgi:sRNA-binding regulator protein Hfq
MRNGAEPEAFLREPETENFGNRKLIRPSLSRETLRAVEPGADRRDRPTRTTERATPAAAAPAPKKSTPAEQTHAENFYYQKQMQSKTPMVVVTRDGEELHGIIEWYDKTCIKLNRGAGQSNLLIYKSAIRYMFKEGEVK